MSDDDTRDAPRLRDQLSSRAIEPIVRAVRTEIGKAGREVADRARSARTGLVLVAVGAVLAVVTVGLLAAVVVTAIAVALPLWAATLIAFGAFAVVSAIVVRVGVSAVSRGVPPVPKDTIAELGGRRGVERDGGDRDRDRDHDGDGDRDRDGGAARD